MLGSNASFQLQIYFDSTAASAGPIHHEHRFLDRPRNQPRGFYVLDEFPQIPSSSVAAFGNTEGLLNRHEPAVEHPRSGKLLRVGNEMLSHAGEDVHFTRRISSNAPLGSGA